MREGEIGEWNSGHLTKVELLSSDNGTEGIRVLEFIKEQVNVCIKKQKIFNG
jgi:hypothetical protein